MDTVFGRSWFLLVAAIISGPIMADCPPPPPPVRDISAEGYYTDKAHSVVDEERKHENALMTKPLDDYLRGVAKLSDQALGGDQEAGRCAISWLVEWAAGGAMLGQMNHINNDQSDYMRNWVEGGAALAYLKVMRFAEPDQRSSISAWLAEIARRDLDYWKNPKKSRNNHYYWTGLGVMAAALAANDERLWDHAVAIYSAGLGDILADGSLPLEMKRGQKAFHYHNFALTPLAVMAHLARWRHQDWFAADDHRLELLAERLRSGFSDQSWFVTESGSPQEPAEPSRQAAWAPFFQPHALNPGQYAALASAAPSFDARLGGSLKALADLPNPFQ